MEPRTISLLRHTDTVAATRNEDRIAIDVYQHAEQTGQPITLGLVEQRLSELLSHEPECPCGLCTAAAAVRAKACGTSCAGGPAGSRPPGAALMR